MSFYSSDFLLPADNWWKVLNPALLRLGDPAMGLTLLLPQHTSTVDACDRKQCFRLRRAGTSASFQDEDNGNISNCDTFQAGKLGASKCLDSTKQFRQFRNPQGRLFDSNFSTKRNTSDTTIDPNELANVVLLLLIISGDIELNPGPGTGN
jgi:hypothetical protein